VEHGTRQPVTVTITTQQKITTEVNEISIRNIIKILGCAELEIIAISLTKFYSCEILWF
jgi:hypothetical protein